jgi:hypothetical protein
VTPLTAQQMRQLDSVRGDLLALAQVALEDDEQARAGLALASGLARISRGCRVRSSPRSRRM